MNLFLVTVKSNYNPSGASFTKGMSVEVPSRNSSPFNNGGKDVIDAFVRKHGMNTSRLTGLSPNGSFFEWKKIS